MPSFFVLLIIIYYITEAHFTLPLLVFAFFSPDDYHPSDDYCSLSFMLL